MSCTYEITSALTFFLRRNTRTSITESLVASHGRCATHCGSTKGDYTGSVRATYMRREEHHTRMTDQSLQARHIFRPHCIGQRYNCHRNLIECSCSTLNYTWKDNTRVLYEEVRRKILFVKPTQWKIPFPLRWLHKKDC